MVDRRRGVSDTGGMDKAKSSGARSESLARARASSERARVVVERRLRSGQYRTTDAAAKTARKAS